MADLSRFFSPVSDEEPSGPDLEYDEAFMALETMARGKPAQTVGEEVIEGEEPRWSEVAEKCEELLERTRDIRVMTHLHAAQIRSDGIRRCLQALRCFAGCSRTSGTRYIHNWMPRTTMTPR